MDAIKALPYTHPLKVVALTFLLAALGGYIYLFHLPIVSDREKLADPTLESNKRLYAYQEEFGNHADFLILVVRAKTKGTRAQQRDAMRAVADGWSDKLRLRPALFPKVIKRIDWSEDSTSPLYYLPLKTFEQLTSGMTAVLPFFRDMAAAPTLSELTKNANHFLAHPGRIKKDTAPNNIEGSLYAIAEIVGIFRRILEGDLASSNQESIFRKIRQLVDYGRFSPNGYFFSQNGSMLTVYALPVRDSGVQNRYDRAMRYANTALQEIIIQDDVAPYVEAGLAGMPALEQEEMQTTQSDFTRSGLLTLLFVSLLFMWGFKNIIKPVLAALSLVLTIAITFLLTKIVVGELNYLATIFSVILIALGIDFAIHFFTHYQQALLSDKSTDEAIGQTISEVGSTLWVAGMATAIAFFSIWFTDFPGLRELGVIAGMGLIVALIIMTLVYPAMLFLLDHHCAKKHPSPINSKPIGIEFFHKIDHLGRNRKMLYLAVPIITLAISGFFFGQYHVDTNLLNLQAADGTANKWQRELISVDDRASFTIATFTNRELLDQKRAALLKNREIIGSTSALFPAYESSKRTLAQPVCAVLGAINKGQPANTSLSGSKKQLFKLRHTIRKYMDRGVEVKSALSPIFDEVDWMYRALKINSGEIGARRVAIVNELIAETVTTLLPELEQLFCPTNFNKDTLPTRLTEQFLGKNGSLSLLIYPKKNSWNRENLDEFMHYVRGIVPDAFGGVASLYDNSLMIIDSFVLAAFYSFAAMLLLLMVLTRSPLLSALSLLPLLTGFGLLIGIMQWWPGKIEWNLANLFALPILVGVGIDGGVHLVQAFHGGNRATYQNALKAVIFSSLTTMIGFGVLTTSHHQGAATLGLVLLIGISTNLIACLLVLPPILEIKHQLSLRVNLR